MSALTLAATPAVLLGGCVVGPHYTRPAPLQGAAPPVRFASSSAVTSATQPSEAWWTLYRDPVLDRYVATALSANTDLRIAIARLVEARAALAGAQSRNLPSTVLSTGGGYGVTSSALAASNAQRIPANGDSIVEAAVDVAWEIDLFGRIRRTIEAAKADSEATEAARDSVRIAVAADTVRAYVEVCTYGQAANVARRSLAILSRISELTTQLNRAGQASGFDQMRVEAFEANARAAIAPLDADRQAALYRLAVLTGQPPETDMADAARCVHAPELAAPIPVGDGRSLLVRRPDIRGAERQLAADTARIGIATADLYPTISLGGSFATQAPTFAGLGASSFRTWSLGPLISWTFPNVSAARSRIRASEAHAQASLARFDAIVLTALSEVEQALASEAAELDRRQALRQARDRDALALTLAGQRFNTGTIGLFEVLDSERSLVADEAAIATSDRVVVEDQVVLFKALGGG